MTLINGQPNIPNTNGASSSAIPRAELDASKLVIDEVPNTGTYPPAHTLVFGKVFAPHMLTIPWNLGTGWGTPKISAYAPLNLEPSAVIFHYAPSLFEGMKAYKDDQGGVRLFRPDLNMERMINSADRLALPTFDGEELVKMIAKLVSIDSAWVPTEPGYSLYIRPTLIGTSPALGVHAAKDALLFVICSPSGPYFADGFKPVSLFANPDKVRAWPGGVGQYKVGGNYAPGIKPQIEAAARGYHQILWLFGPDELITEVGAMNLFVVIRAADGVDELISPPLNGMILPGVTRNSILGLGRAHADGTAPIAGLGRLRVAERECSMREIAAAAASGNLVEVFGSGTAAIVSPVERIGYGGADIPVPVAAGGAGPYAAAMVREIEDIQRGRRKNHPWSIVIR